MLTKEQRDEVERKIAQAQLEAERKLREQREGGATYIDHTNEEVPGRFAALNKTQVVGKAKDPWPVMPEGNPWSATQPQPGAERTFGTQLHSFDVPLSSVQEKKR